MFGGTGAFRNHLCPHLKTSSKNPSFTPSSSPSTCGRPHCKYSHSVEIFTEQQNGPSLQSPLSLPKRLPFPEEENFPSESLPALPAAVATSFCGQQEISGDETVRGVQDAIGVAAPIHNGEPAPLAQLELEESILALQKSGITGLIDKHTNGEVTAIRPTYSDAPAQALNDHNPYKSVWDEPLAGTPQTNDLQYDPVSNWRLPFRSIVPTVKSTSSLSETQPADEVVSSSQPTETSIPPTATNMTSAAAIRNRFANTDSVIALGRKYSGKDALPNTSTLPKVSAYGGGPAQGSVVNKVNFAHTASSSSSANMPARRKAGSPASDLPKPVKKKARFGRSIDDEEVMDVEEVLTGTNRIEQEGNKAEMMRNLFGIDDDDEEDADDDLMELPIEMPKKNPVKGFPKNSAKLLQNLSAALEVPKPVPAAQNVPSRPVQPPKKKIATAQQQLETRMKAIDEQRKQQQQPHAAPSSAPSSSTGVPVAAVDKGSKRVAHQPKTAQAEGASIAPRCAVVSGSKLSLPFRQQVLEKFIQHMSQIYKSPQEAIERAIQTEKDIAAVSFHMGTYRNKATQELVNLKKAVTSTSPGSSAIGAKTGQKDKPMVFPKVQTAVSPQAQKQNFSVVQKVTPQQRAVVTEPKLWSEQDFYTVMKKYVLTEDDLVINGYPLIQTKKQDGENRRDGLQLYIAMSGKITSDRITQNRRNCCRCKKEFFVDFEGNYGREEECLYHWGKAFSQRVAGEGMAAKRTCCSDESSSRGCCVAKFHVADTIPSLSGFVATTGIKSLRPEDRFRVYAIDCEMIYTVGGIELARVTVVDRFLKCVYESLVKPKQRIVDCNTRFSGLKMEQFTRDSGKGIKTIEDIHKDLLGGLINEDTILIGHSLESDLLAMKMIHRNIVDTSIVFKHKRGLPYKRALRNLMRELLQKIIQEDVGGHDSREDAGACMELMIWKMKQDRERRV